MITLSYLKFILAFLMFPLFGQAVGDYCSFYFEVIEKLLVLLVYTIKYCRLQNSQLITLRIQSRNIRIPLTYCINAFLQNNPFQKEEKQGLIERQLLFRKTNIRKYPFRFMDEELSSFTLITFRQFSAFFSFYYHNVSTTVPCCIDQMLIDSCKLQRI